MKGEKLALGCLILLLMFFLFIASVFVADVMYGEREVRSEESLASSGGDAGGHGPDG